MENMSKYLYDIFTGFQIKIYWALLYLQDLYEHCCTFQQMVGKTQIEIEVAVAKQTKNVQFCFFQGILEAAIFYHRQRDISKHILNLVFE